VVGALDHDLTEVLLLKVGEIELLIILRVPFTIVAGDHVQLVDPSQSEAHDRLELVMI
jgi:hypothetical protein